MTRTQSGYMFVCLVFSRVEKNNAKAFPLTRMGRRVGVGGVDVIEKFFFKV